MNKILILLRMKYFNFLFLLLLLPVVAKSQNSTIQWQKSFGGGFEESARSVVQTPDGGYIVAGKSKSYEGDLTVNYGNFDFWIVKINAMGILQWQKSYGGSGEDEATSIRNTSDGGYIVAGFTFSSDGNITVNKGAADYWIVKLNANGDVEWQKTYGGPGNDRANAIKQTPDGGYVVAGFSNSVSGDITNSHGNNMDYWILKLNSTGNIQWQKSIGGLSDDKAYDIDLTSDGGYIVTGDTSSSSSGDRSGNTQGGADVWVVKLSSAGNIVWEKAFGGSAADLSFSVKQTKDGGYIVAGDTKSQNGDIIFNNGGNDYWIIKLNSAGNLEWQKTLGGGAYDRAQSIIQLSDGNYMAVGYSPSSDGDVIGNNGAVDYWLVKLNQNGDFIWQKCLGGSGSEFPYSLIQSSDGGVVIAGESDTNNNSGDVTGNHGFRDFWVVKLNSVLGVNESAIANGISIHPNPAKNFFKINNLPMGTAVTIYDISGRVILSQKYNQENISVDISQIKNGNYIVKAENSGKVVLSEKLIIVH